jgi:AraC family transcriptional regulator of adaptative response/methylated-DNA-[protein]-cysteine methyltransferase
MLETAVCTLAMDDERWDAVVRRDGTADGQFFYSVRTTGVYCRPSCGSRQARRENVQFHVTATEAERAGFRPCKRCRPDEPALAEERTRAVAKACRLIDESDERLSLETVAAAVGMSAFYFHRVFKSVTGLTPKAYSDARRGQRVRGELASAENSVTGAVYGAGFNSSGPFYAVSDKLLGMTPSRFRDGGRGVAIRFAVGQCSLGAILVAATERGVCSILLGDEPESLVHDLEARFRHAELVGGDGDFEQLVAKVVGLVEAPRLGFDLPLDVRGTAFQQRVWQELTKIPAGSTASYTEIARHLGAPTAARAVAAACAANPIAVAIPCHRVVRTDGALSGYRWGIERKRELLGREANG